MKYKFLIFFIIFNTLVLCKDTINLATDSFEPFYGPDLKNKGFFSEIVTAAFNEVDIDVNIYFVPWKRAYDLASIGKYDGLLGAFHTNEREVYFNYTDGIWLNKVSFFSKKNKEIYYENLDSLLNYKIGIVRDYSYSAEFDYNNALDKMVSPTSERNLNLLIHNRIDVLVDSEPVILNLLNTIYTEDKNKVEIVGHLSNRWLHVLISKKKKDSMLYVKKFNEGLKIIKKNGKYDEILKNNNLE